MSRIIFICAFLLCFSAFDAISKGNKRLPAERKQLEALRITGGIKIDGDLSEPEWALAKESGGFTQYEPYSGVAASEQSTVKVLYDDNALYIGAFLHDSNPNSIYRELGLRDQSDNLKSDAFSVLVSPYNDGINYQEFLVSASGVQTDFKYVGTSKDRNWNAVWLSHTQISDNGWYVEIKIPYSALRFSKNGSNSWGINFVRLIKRHNERSSWNPIDRTNSSVLVSQSGELTGLSGINPPVRLSFSPYLSAYADKYAGADGFEYKVNGGMDVKLGLNESFTLDMTLIPDFGQVKSDDRVLNLSPFEVYYDEQRGFFTEGTELFNKGGIFYSRRIGSRPAYYGAARESLASNEVVYENPIETKMLNATKISGRTSSGTGLGLFNAITDAAYARIEDTITGEKRKIRTQAFTNYNMVVVDQTLPYNSYISLANTNVLRSGDDYIANVTATEVLVRDPSNQYAFKGIGAVSQHFANEDVNGYKYRLELHKTAGAWLGNVWHNVESDTYNPNDMGYLQNNNEFSYGGEVTYRRLVPFSKFLDLNTWAGFSQSKLFEPRAFTRNEVYIGARSTLAKNNLTLGVDMSTNLKDEVDYYEPRRTGSKLIIPKHTSMSFWTSSDYRKPLALDTKMGYWYAERMAQDGYWVSLSPRMRLNNYIMVVYTVRQDYEANNLGYADSNQTDVFIGSRNISTLTNTVDGRFSLNANSVFSLRVRHYWRWVDYKDFSILLSDGNLTPTAPMDDKDKNYNIFNLDLTYQWNFAPGSVLSVVWKNAIETSESQVNTDFLDNFGTMVGNSASNSLSFKMLYYLDYQSLRRKKSVS
ncbi:MAG: carbohydrate binding family 9 domain-containing protein [Bacteroidales bacterium]|nr:carbohydrate binding family 9 domain-containing protein [Bacteroidales bacterium]MBN2747880.1 carbohydrate binding family 9 domain-containing protein [Bacteroidales bacterium]